MQTASYLGATRPLLAAALLGALASGCPRSSGPRAGRPASDTAGAAVPHTDANAAAGPTPRPLGRWVRTGFTTPIAVVLRDSAALADFWRQAGAGGPPPIDFSREVVIGAALGERRSGGYAVRIGAARPVDGGTEIEILEQAPGAGCMSTMSLTQPATAAALPREAVKGAVRFTHRVEQKPC